MRALIVDDEVLSRRGVRVCLRKAPDVEVVGEATCGVEALTAVEALRPDLVFLDVHMPGINGLEVAARLDAKSAPLIVFLTAYDEFALGAFAVHAVDYLLKPIHDRRFREAMEVVRERLRDRQARAVLGDATVAEAQRVYSGFVAAKTGTKTVYVGVDEIDWIEAAGDYVAVHVGTKTHLIRETMEGLERQLDPAKLVRIHRSAMVARARIQQLQSLPSRDVAVVLRDGTVLRASRTFRKRLA